MEMLKNGTDRWTLGHQNDRYDNANYSIGNRINKDFLLLYHSEPAVHIFQGSC